MGRCCFFMAYNNRRKTTTNICGELQGVEIHRGNILHTRYFDFFLGRLAGGQGPQIQARYLTVIASSRTKWFRYKFRARW